QIRKMLGDSRFQRDGIGDRGDDDESDSFEHGREALAQQCAVLGENHPALGGQFLSHGSSTRTMGAPPGGLDSSILPSSTATRSAPPRPSSTISTTSRSLSRRAVSPTWVASACLAILFSASTTTK